MFRKYRLAIVAAFLTIPLAGCGGNDVDSPIAKSPYAPTQAQLDELSKSAMPHNAKSTGRSNARKPHM
ncbi:hypothetical protein [Paludisphaera borealis]|uniref:Lipoprotein n=1 Tax=Paludisphaera borealis TaxID=1387353 RepID=A0A1U7CKW0_9BACT|nr:hypothetical protein [Paludisphaera borealis]APW59561.1 hypothetical protein BSF38_00987 [Paludisphaera borealis]MDR3621867.1 hypothetical protein [Paludisphaera borealis]